MPYVRLLVLAMMLISTIYAYGTMAVGIFLKFTVETLATSYYSHTARELDSVT